MNYKTIPDMSLIDVTVQKLTESGFSVAVVENRDQAKEKTLSMIPKNAEVFTMTSVTLDESGISERINNSSSFLSVRNTLYGSDRTKDHRTMQRMGAAPEYAIGSVHAVTQDGTLMIASNTGSQLSAYVYGADHVIFVIGAQKIVSNLDKGFERINDYVLPLESERARKAYGVAGSNVSKLLLIHNEVKPDRITIILVKEVLGY